MIYGTENYCCNVPKSHHGFFFKAFLQSKQTTATFTAQNEGNKPYTVSDFFKIPLPLFKKARKSALF
jgi:hypothetical protein